MPEWLTYACAGPMWLQRTEVGLCPARQFVCPALSARLIMGSLAAQSTSRTGRLGAWRSPRHIHAVQQSDLMRQKNGAVAIDSRLYKYQQQLDDGSLTSDSHWTAQLLKHTRHIAYTTQHNETQHSKTHTHTHTTTCRPQPYPH